MRSQDTCAFPGLCKRFKKSEPPQAKIQIEMFIQIGREENLGLDLGDSPITVVTNDAGQCGYLNLLQFTWKITTKGLVRLFIHFSVLKDSVITLSERDGFAQIVVEKAVRQFQVSKLLGDDVAESGPDQATGNGSLRHAANVEINISDGLVNILQIINDLKRVMRI